MSGSSPPSKDFESWYGREHSRLTAALAAVSGDWEAGSDAADEAFSRALAHWDRVASMSSPSGWTYRVGLNYLHRISRRRLLEARLLRRTMVQEARPVDNGYQETVALLQVLSARQRTAIVLRYIADLPESDIAEAMGIRRGTVASTLHDARHRLAALLRDPADSEVHR